MERKIENTIEGIRKSLIKEFKFIETIYSYFRTNSDKRQELYDELINVKYLNEKINREISISLIKDLNHDVGLLNISIVRMPYKDVSDFFSFREYLKIKGNSERMIIDFGSENDHVFSLIKSIFLSFGDECSGLISGSTWNKHSYPRKD